MKLYGLILSFVIFIPVLCFTQTKISFNDSIEIYSLFDKADIYSDESQFDSALAISLKIIEITEQKHYLYENAQAHIQCADYLYQLGEFDKLPEHDSAALLIGLQMQNNLIIARAQNKLGLYFVEVYEDAKAESAFYKALEFAPKSSVLRAEIYNNFGYLYGLVGQNDEAIENYMLAMRIYDDLNNSSDRAQTYSNLSALMNSIGDNNKAIYYQKLCIDIRENTKDHKGLALAYLNLTNIYIQLDSLKKAEEFLQKGLKNAELANSKKIMAQVFMNIGALKHKQNDFKGALEAELKNIELLEEMNDQDAAARRYLAAGAYAYALKDTSAELMYYQKSLAISQQTNNTINLRDVYGYLTPYYKNVKKDYTNAYESLKKYYVYRDSISNKETAMNIAEIQTKYETEKKDNEIVKLQNLRIIQGLEIDKQKAINSGNLLLAKQKQNEIEILKSEQELRDLKLDQQKDELIKQHNLAQIRDQQIQISSKEKELNLKQLQKERVIRNGMIAFFIIATILGFVLFNRYQLKKQLQQKEALLVERTRISSDLHDDIGSALSGISIYSELGKMKTAGNTELQNILNTISDNTKNTQQNMQDIIWSLNPYNDNFQKIITRMKTFAAEILEPKNIILQFNSDVTLNTIDLNPDKRKDFFLLFKEAINNCTKYASAKIVVISVRQNDGLVYLTIKDDGIGFDPETIKKGNGLNTMYERAKAMNSTLKISSTPGKGTLVELTLNPT